MLDINKKLNKRWGLSWNFMNSFKISPSYLNSFLHPFDGNPCKKKWYYESVRKIRSKRNEDSAAFRGQVFEYNCIGGKEEVFKKQKNGKPYAHEVYIDELVVLFNKIKNDLSIKVEEIQYHLEDGEWKGYVDFLGSIKNPDYGFEKAIFDLKYTEVANNKFSKWNFSENGYMTNEQKQHYNTIFNQGCFYHTLHYCITGESLPVYFLVFGKSGWSKIQRFEFSKEKREMFVDMVYDVMTTIYEGGFKPIPTMEGCKNCVIKYSCKESTSIPIIENYLIK